MRRVIACLLVSLPLGGAVPRVAGASFKSRKNNGSNGSSILGTLKSAFGRNPSPLTREEKKNHIQRRSALEALGLTTLVSGIAHGFDALGDIKVIPPSVEWGVPAGSSAAVYFAVNYKKLRDVGHPHPKRAALIETLAILGIVGATAVALTQTPGIDAILDKWLTNDGTTILQKLVPAAVGFGLVGKSLFNKNILHFRKKRDLEPL